MKRGKTVALTALLALGGLLAAALVAFGLLRWRGWLLFPQEAAPDPWKVWGVDVSSYQGDVDWAVLRDQGVDFAFIKATEGSGTADRYFEANWKNAHAAGVLAGAYHFFSYDSPGETQADNFIAQVPVTAGALPPVVDIEFYGDKAQDPPAREAVAAILDPLLERLEAKYGQKPILYATYRSYQLYLQGSYEDYPLWITRPLLAPVDKDWTFWQYSHSARLPGYQGSEERIDLNVFRGSIDELRAMGLTLDEGQSARLEAEELFTTLRADAYPGLTEYGLDLTKLEEDLHTYVAARSALDAYLACSEDGGPDFAAAKTRAEAEHYNDFAWGIQDAYQFDRPEQQKSREITLDNPIDPWTKKWLYQDGTTIAMNVDAATERDIWRMEWENACDELERRLGDQDEWKETAQAARDALLDFAPAYGDCVGFLQFSCAFYPKWWRENPDDPISRGTGLSFGSGSNTADCFRRETLLLWQRLDVENATWVFEASGYEAELTERYEQIYGKDISEFQTLVEEATQ